MWSPCRCCYSQFFSLFFSKTDLIVFALLLLALFERPSWCLGDQTMQLPDLCDGVPSSKLPRLSRASGSALEAIALSLIFIDVCLSMLLAKPRRWLQGYHRPVRAVALVVAWLDVVVLNSAWPERSVRLAPYLRPVIAVATWSRTRKVLISVVRSLR